jgi:hypothetical protein
MREQQHMVGATSNGRGGCRGYQQRFERMTRCPLILWPLEQLLTAAGGGVTHTIVEFASVGRERLLWLNLHGDKQCNCS